MDSHSFLNRNIFAIGMDSLGMGGPSEGGGTLQVWILSTSTQPQPTGIVGIWDDVALWIDGSTWYD